MKRWLSLLLALMFAFSACALAEPADATAIDSSIGNQTWMSCTSYIFMINRRCFRP